MHYMVLFVIDNVDSAPKILETWENAGAAGITILDSTGLGRMKKHFGIRDDLPLMPSMSSLLGTREEKHRTIFTVTDDEAMVDKLIEETQNVAGDLEAANRGVIFVLPVVRAVGINYDNRKED